MRNMSMMIRLCGLPTGVEARVFGLPTGVEARVCGLPTGVEARVCGLPTGVEALVFGLPTGVEALAAQGQPRTSTADTCVHSRHSPALAPRGRGARQRGWGGRSASLHTLNNSDPSNLILRRYRYSMYPSRVITQTAIRRAHLGIALTALLGCSRGDASGARVSCHTSRDGITCAVAHSQGVSANVCWDLMVLCRNRTRGSAHACQVVSFGRQASRIVPMSAVQMPDTCDAVLTVDVEHVVATE